MSASSTCLSESRRVKAIRSFRNCLERRRPAGAKRRNEEDTRRTHGGNSVRRRAGPGPRPGCVLASTSGTGFEEGQQFQGQGLGSGVKMPFESRLQGDGPWLSKMGMAPMQMALVCPGPLARCVHLRPRLASPPGPMSAWTQGPNHGGGEAFHPWAQSVPGRRAACERVSVSS